MFAAPLFSKFLMFAAPLQCTLADLPTIREIPLHPPPPKCELLVYQDRRHSFVIAPVPALFEMLTLFLNLEHVFPPLVMVVQCL
jgi:hypothetical protein